MYKILFVLFVGVYLYAAVDIHQYDVFVKKASQKYDVDEDLIRTVIYIESTFNKDAKSPKGALGLMQMVPKTGVDMGVTPEELMDPEKSIMSGTKYLAWLKSKSWIKDNKALLLASYNGGLANTMNGKVPAFPETEKYVIKGKKLYEKWSGKDFGDIPFSRNQDNENNNSNSDSGSTSTRKVYYPSSAALNYKNKLQANSGNYCSVINGAPPKTLIVLAAGNYGGCQIRNKSYLTIKGASKDSVVFTSSGWSWELSSSSYINFIDYTAKNSNLGKLPDNYKFKPTHHIYFGNITLHDIKSPESSAFFTDGKAHDITLDRISMLGKSQSAGYGWYGQGYHHVISNSLFTHFGSSIFLFRGYYPLNAGERIGWVSTHTYRKPNIYNGGDWKKLEKDDWTHLVVNNTFAFTKSNGGGKGRGNGADREAFLSFYSGGPQAGDKEQAQFPPQNIVIENNVFYGAHKRSNLEGSITIQSLNFPSNPGSGKLHGGRPVIRGTVIRNNVSDQKLLRIIGGNKSLLTLENNKESVGKAGVGLVDPEGGNFSPKDDAVLVINQSAINGNYQPFDIESRKRDEHPDIGAYEGKSNNSVPPPTKLPPTNVPSISEPIEEPAEVYDGTGLTLKPAAALANKNDTCVRDCNSQYERGQEYIREMTEIRLTRIAEEIEKLKEPLDLFATQAEEDFQDHKALAHDLMKQKYVQFKLQEHLVRKENNLNEMQISIIKQKDNVLENLTINNMLKKIKNKK